MRVRVAVILTLCAAGAVLLGCDRRVAPDATVAGPARASFADVTSTAGIRFRHASGAAGAKLLPETMGAGVVAFDYDNDGRPDLYFVNSCPWPGAATEAKPTGTLYRNLGDGTFEDTTAAAGLAVVLFGLGGCAGDFDNDGFPDLFVTAVGGNRLFRNVGGVRFEDATDRAGLGDSTWPAVADGTEFGRWNRPVTFPSSATWLDFDGDGRLDLFVCQYVSWSPALDSGIHAQLPGGNRAYVPPTQFPGTHCKLYRNLGDGRFADASAASGIEVSEPTGVDGRTVPIGKSLGVVACDPDGDGWPDLAVANDTVRNFFFHNVPDGRGGRKFDEIGLTANVAYAEGRPRGGMGIDAADLEPGKTTLLVANFSNESNTLLSVRKTKPLVFEDNAMAWGLAAPSRGPMKFGALFFDYDLDGRTDLLTANGHLEPDIALARPLQKQAEAAQLFRHVGTPGGPRFETVADAGDLLKPLVGRGAAYLDFDGDGAPDIVLSTNGGAAKLFRNENATARHWLRLKLVGDGARSNRDAIGAAVEVTTATVTRRFYVSGARGYLSQSELVLTVGLGEESTVNVVTVRWPGQNAGVETWTALAIDREHRLVQSSP
jgi:hypothetical protein